MIRIDFVVYFLLIPSSFQDFQRFGEFKETFNKFKDKMIDEKSKSRIFQSENSLYPGANETARKLHQNRWNEYYNCLNNQAQHLEESKTLTPEALLGLQGNYIDLECKICLSPKEENLSDLTQWEFIPAYNTTSVNIEINEHIVWNAKERLLKIYNLQLDQTGQYWCKIGSTIGHPYFLTIIEEPLNITEVHSKDAKIGPYSQEGKYVHDNTIYLSMHWGAWSSCSKCGKVGKRHRIGYCIVKSASQTQVTENEMKILQMFPKGIPCLSYILPDKIKKIKEIQQRVTEVMTGYCKVNGKLSDYLIPLEKLQKPCTGSAIFEVRDRNGNLIETANNSAGYYSMLQGLPPTKPDVQRILQYENTGTNIVITCPSNLNSYTPIEWSVSDRKLIADLIREQSKGRISITSTDKLVIKHAKTGDSNIYSCFQDGELTGIVRLIVEETRKFNFNHHILLFGIVVTLSTFLYVFTKAFFGRKYATITK